MFNLFTMSFICTGFYELLEFQTQKKEKRGEWWNMEIFC